MTHKRITYGSYKNMTPEEQRAHRLKLAARWRANNRKKISEKNHYFWEKRKELKPAICVCKVCGQEFNAPRRVGYTRCDKCKAA